MKVYVRTVKNKKTYEEYVPAGEIKINNKQTLAEYVEANELEISELKKEVAVLRQALGEVIKTFGGVEE